MTNASAAAPRIWVDADACPRVIKDILYRASERSGLQLLLVANQPLAIPRSPLVRSIVVAGGFDVADRTIVERVVAGDLVITADIPLAADVLQRGAAALSPRGERFLPDSIAQKLTMRDFLDQLRGSGVQTGGPPPLSDRDKHQFAAALDRWLVQRK